MVDKFAEPGGQRLELADLFELEPISVSRVAFIPGRSLALRATTMPNVAEGADGALKQSRQGG
jgi:hypothetical protein